MLGLAIGTGNALRVLGVVCLTAADDNGWDSGREGTTSCGLGWFFTMSVKGTSLQARPRFYCPTWAGGNPTANQC